MKFRDHPPEGNRDRRLDFFILAQQEASIEGIRREPDAKSSDEFRIVFAWHSSVRIALRGSPSFLLPSFCVFRNDCSRISPHQIAKKYSEETP